MRISANFGKRPRAGSFASTESAGRRKNRSNLL